MHPPPPRAVTPRRLAGTAIPVLVLAAVGAACGARTGLIVDGLDGAVDAPPPRPDAWRPDAFVPDDPCEPSGTTVPLLRYPFDGDLENHGALAPAHPGMDVEGVELTGGRCGGAVVVGDPGHVRFLDTAAVLASLDAATLGVWVYEERATSSGPVWLGCRSPEHGFHAYRGVTEEELTVCYGAGDPREGPGGCRGMPLAARRWHHLAFRFAGPGSAFEVLVDGAPAITFTSEDAGYDVFGATVSDLFGGYDEENPGGRRTRIRLDDLRVYDGALDDATLCTEVIGGRRTGSRCVALGPPR